MDNTLDPEFEIGGEHGDSDAAVRARAAYAAGFTGDAARALVLRGNTPAQFAAAVSEAREIKSLAAICAAGTGVDTALAVNDAIVKGIPLATVRADITDLLATLDDNAQIDTSPHKPKEQAAQTSAVYAQREAQIDAARGAKNG